MLKSIEVSGKTEEEAIALVLSELGLDRDEVSVEIVQRAKTGFLGLGATPAIVRISYEHIEIEEDPYEKVRSFLSGLLQRMGVEAEIAVTERPSGGVNVELSGRNMGAVIGRRGETLDAIQHLANYVVNAGAEKRLHINVDAENYRSKREESLIHLAQKMAAKVLKYKRSMALEPMNSYERHIIHTALQDVDGVSTCSTGTEPNRRVVVSFDKAQPGQSSRPASKEWR